MTSTASAATFAPDVPVLVTVNGTPHTRNMGIDSAERLASGLRGMWRLAVVKVELESEWRIWES